MQKYKGERWTKNYARTKNYLYDRILTFIREANSDQETDLHALLEKIKILFQKRLFHHLPRFLEKAQGLAVKMEDFDAALRLIDYEKEVLLEGGDYERYSNAIGAILQRSETLSDQRNEVIEMAHVRDRLIAGRVRGIEYINAVIDSPLLAEGRQYKSATAHILSKRIRFDFYFYQGEIDKAITQADIAIASYQSKSGLIASYAGFKNFVYAVYYSAALKIVQSRFQEAEQTITLLATFAGADKREPALYLERTTWFEVSIARKTLDQKRGERAIESYLDQLNHGQLQFSEVVKIELDHLVAVFQINFGNPKDALVAVLRNRNRKIENYRPDLLYFSKVLFMVVHTELRNLDVVESSIRSTRQSLLKQGKLTPFYSLILNFFAGFCKAKSKDKEARIAKDFASQFDSGSWGAAVNYFDFGSWAKSLYSNQPMTKTLAEKFQSAKDRQ
ncbi:MAG: hypothetical protein AAF998_10490 [Bacteroidota bacterium]